MVRLYLMRTALLRDHAVFSSAVCGCSAERQRKIAAFRDPEAQLQSLAAALLLDQALQAVGKRERDMRYRYLSGGKPLLEDMPEFRFSLSHSGEWALCAASDQEVGADIQVPRKFPDQLATRYFTEKERQQAEMLRLWTLKESYGKLTGEGVAVLGRTELELAADVRLLDGGAPADVSFWEKELSDGTRIAVCCRGAAPVEVQLMFDTE